MLAALVLGIAVSLISAQEDERIYTIAIGHDYGPQEYIDQEGYLKGFAHDIIDAVCREAKIDCRTVWDTRDGNCWISTAGEHPSGGRGIQDRWFDGCSGWDATIERIHTFKFSAAFTKTIGSFFYYRMRENFNEMNLKDKTIGIVKNWAASEKCIARQATLKNNVLDKNHTKAYDSATLLLQGLKNREIDAAFADEFTFPAAELGRSITFQSSRPYSCILAGNSIMMRKDNNLLEFWNVGFNKLVQTRRYHDVCSKGDDSHGHRGAVNCDI